MFQREILCLAMILLLGCAGGQFPLDGEWTVVRDKTDSQRKQRLGEVEVKRESEADWQVLSAARFDISNHSKLNVRLREEKMRTLPISVRELEPNLWLIQTQYAEQSFQMKAARVGNELRILDAGHLFVLEQR